MKSGVRSAALVVTSASVLILVASIAGAPRAQPDRFFTEKQTVSAYSSLLLILCSLCSLLTHRVERAAERRGLAPGGLLTFWKLATVGFFLIGADDYFAMHEGIDDAAARLAGVGWGEGKLKLDAIIVVGYGVAGLVTLSRFRRPLAAIAGFWPFIVAGGGFAAASVLVDGMFDEVPPYVFLEDGAKVFANSMFLLACVCALRASFARVLAAIPPPAVRDA